MHMVCVPADRVAARERRRAGGLPANVRRFGANSCDLHAIADWLTECGVTTVAMESTGVYWIPLFELLESRGFEVWLVEPGQLSRCGAGPRPTCSTCSGFSGCTPTACCGRRSGRPIRSWPCAATTASGRCRSVMPPATSSTCKRLWSR